MTVMMNSTELNREEGRLEERQDLARKMLQKGVAKDFIKEHFEFDDAQVEALKNGEIDDG